VEAAAAAAAAGPQPLEEAAAAAAGPQLLAMCAHHIAVSAMQAAQTQHSIAQMVVAFWSTAAVAPLRVQAPSPAAQGHRPIPPKVLSRGCRTQTPCALLLEVPC